MLLFNNCIVLLKNGKLFILFSLINVVWSSNVIFVVDKFIIDVSLCVILNIVPVNGIVCNKSVWLFIVPISIGAKPVNTCPLIFVCIGNGILPKSIVLPFECASKNVKSTRSWLNNNNNEK